MQPRSTHFSRVRRLAIILAALFISLNASAQVGISFGVASTGSTVGEAWASINSADRYQLGALYRMNLLGGLFVVQPQVFYNFHRNSSGGSLFDLSDGYLEIPVQCQVGFTVLNLLRPYAMVEPLVGYDFASNVLGCGICTGVGIELFNHVQVGVKCRWDTVNCTRGSGLMLSTALLF